MNPSEFFFNNQWSSVTDSFIRNKPTIPSAKRIKEFRERPGGTKLIIDKSYYDNVPLSLDCYFKAPSIEETSHYQNLVTRWLDFGNYTQTEFMYDPHYTYLAAIESEPIFQLKNSRVIPYSFALELLPFKLNKSGLYKRKFSKSIELVNPEQYPSNPEIHIFGQGDIRLTINNQSIMLKGVVNDIQLDCEEKECFRYMNDILINQSHLKFGNYPVLETGLNKIEVVGNVSRVEIIPRWCTKI